MTRRKKIQLQQLIGIIIAWQVVALLITIYDHFVAYSLYIETVFTQYSFFGNIAFNSISALLAALTGGYFLIAYINVRFIDKPYGYTILAVYLVFVTIISFVIVTAGFFYVPYIMGVEIGDLAFWSSFRQYATDTFHMKNILVWSIVVALTQFILQMNSKFGHGILWDIIRGKYQVPREENRIFMFVDLNSSTAMAEQLGDENYHRLLKDFFADITNPIVDNKGDIYQYVGDEVVIAWKYERGIENSQCINCFFEMKSQIERNKEKYLKEYGLVPGFKAGIHFGKVIAGEIGIIKRDITFSGDVLNTTSRIQSKCKEFNVEVIASDDLLSQLSFAGRFISTQLGSIKLRGKEKEMGLSTLAIS